MTASTALAGPLPVIRFWDETTIVYTPPRDTLDPRFAVCSDHRPACDCREAEWSEQRQEWRAAAADRRQLEQAVEAIGKIHRSESMRPAGSGRMCMECLKAWPCPTFRLAAPVSWLLRLLEERGEA